MNQVHYMRHLALQPTLVIVGLAIPHNRRGETSSRTDTIVVKVKQGAHDPWGICD